METYGESLHKATNDPVVFAYITSNESLKAALQGRTDDPKIIIIGAPLNEIVLKVKSDKKKGRDETVRLVSEELNNIVSESAAQKPNCLHLIMPPFLRQDPNWIEKRMGLALFYIKDFVGKKGIWNVAVGSNVEIIELTTLGISNVKYKCASNSIDPKEEDQK